MTTRIARFQIGDVVRHRVYAFRGVIFDVDPEFANTEEWWQAIPEDLERLTRTVAALGEQLSRPA